MKRLIVKACGNSPLEDIRASIEARLSYAQLQESLESFRILIFQIPDENIDQVKNDVHGCGHTCFWDTIIKLDPIEEESNSIQVDNAVLDPFDNTKFAVSTYTATQYVRVTQVNGQNLYEFSPNGSAPWYRSPNVITGFPNGWTIKFDVTDSSMSSFPLKFSETQDGTHKGGTLYTQGVTYGTNSVDIVFSGASADKLFFYTPSSPGLGRYTTSPDRYMTISPSYNTWHLNRISKNGRGSALTIGGGTFSWDGGDGDGIDIYVIDSGVRGASRPTGAGAALHPELFHPDNRADLDGASEQGDYRVYSLSHYGASAFTPNINEDTNGHGTACAVLAAGYRYGVAKKARIYSLAAFNSQLAGTFSDIAAAYQAVINHHVTNSGYYKGNNRPSIINASFGATQPSAGTPIIELNDVGTDYPYNDIEILDEIESTVCRSHNIIICRSAGNGFLSASDTFLGPLQAKMKPGSRTGGPIDYRFNAVDYDQPKVVVGATEWNDTYADFSNYGDAVDVYAPGTRVECPKYDWTTTTSYLDASWSTWYSNISGTSFSTPIVAGVLAVWLDYFNYDYTTTGLPQKAKDWVNTPNPGFRTDSGRNTNYPINGMDERELVSDPFTTSNGSSQIVVKFNPADASYFLGNINKKVQIRTPYPPATIVGNINLTEALRQWWGIIAEDAVANTLTIDLGTSNVFTSSNVNVGGAGPFSMGIVTGTFQETDGPHYGSVSLTTRTDYEEANNTGLNVGTGLPVDAGYYNYVTKTFTPPVNRGIMFPFVMKQYTWDQGQGIISQSPIAHNSNISINLGYSTAVAVGGENLSVGPWTITGDSLIGTNITFNTSTGYLESPSTSSYFQDSSFNVTVTDTSSGNAQTYSFTLAGSGVNNIRSFTGGSPAVPGNLKFGSSAQSDLDKYWKVDPAIDGNWGTLFGAGNQNVNNITASNGTKPYGNHTFVYTDVQMRDQGLNKIDGNQHTSDWTDQTPPPTLNYTIVMTSADMRDQGLNKLDGNQHNSLWTKGPRPGVINYTLTYLNPTVFVSPGRPTALLGFGQIYPRFFEEVDEETVPAETPSGTGLAEITYMTNNSPPAPETGTIAGLRTSRELLKDKRPRVGLLFPRGNTYRADEN